MRRPQDRQVLVTLVVGALSLIWAIAAAAVELAVDLSSPEATVRSLERGLVQVSAVVDQDDVDARYAALAPLIGRTHDLERIARLTVGRHWRDFSDDERTRFVAAFERLSIMNYAARFGAVGEDTFRFIGVEPGDRATVSTLIQRKADDDISLDYTLEHGEMGWRIINIATDGVSDLAIRRTEYQRVLEDSSADGLVAYIEEQTAALR